MKATKNERVPQMTDVEFAECLTLGNSFAHDPNAPLDPLVELEVDIGDRYDGLLEIAAALVRLEIRGNQ